MESTRDDAAENRRRGLVAVVVLVPLLALLALLGWSLVRSGGQPAGIAINSTFGEVSVREGPARDFSLALFNGQTMRLSDLRGSVVMVDFWSSWCPPCRKEAPALASTYRRYQDRGVEFVGVVIWDTADEATKLLESAGTEYRNGMDGKGQIAIDYGLTGIPEKYFIDREGMLVRKFIGPVTEGELERILDELLAR